MRVGYRTININAFRNLSVAVAVPGGASAGAKLVLSYASHPASSSASGALASPEGSHASASTRRKNESFPETDPQYAACTVTPPEPPSFDSGSIPDRSLASAFPPPRTCLSSSNVT